MNNQQIFRALAEAIAEDGRAALGTVVATRGSTPQKVGAKLLIRADGQSSSGTLGGGCVEAQVWQDAIRALASGQPHFARYELTDDYAGDNGMVCGGAMDILVDIWPAADLELAQRVADELAVGRTCLLTTIVEGDGVGGKRLSGGAGDERWAMARNFSLPHEAVDEAQPTPHLKSLPATSDQRPATIFHEPLGAQAALIIVGAGHVAQTLCQLASFAGFAVTVVDNRERFASAERFPTAAQVLAADIDATLPHLPIGPHTYIVIVTRGHQFDEGALRLVVNSPAAYIGMIGSRRKVLLVYQRMVADGYDPALLRRIYAPLGLEIGAETVEEIAVSIVAELIKVRRRGAEAEVQHMNGGLAHYLREA